MPKLELCISSHPRSNLYLSAKSTHKSISRIPDTLLVFFYCGAGGVFYKPLPVHPGICMGYIFLLAVRPEGNNGTKFIVQEPFWFGYSLESNTGCKAQQCSLIRYCIAFPVSYCIGRVVYYREVSSNISRVTGFTNGAFKVVKIEACIYKII